MQPRFHALIRHLAGSGFVDRPRGLAAPATAMVLLSLVPVSAGDLEDTSRFRKEVKPLLTEFCADCHFEGTKKGNVAFDEFPSDRAMLEDRRLWLTALKNLRAGLMPPAKKPQPSAEQKRLVEDWIKSAVFQSDPHNPDPGRVTVRRLNRIEYRNTIRDLMGIDFDSLAEFPADDTGHGFDNIGDVLTLSPMLMEKFLAAAQTIVGKAVPSAPTLAAERVIVGKDFVRVDDATKRGTNQPAPSGSSFGLSYYDPATLSHTLNATNAGSYHLVLDLSANERFVDNQFDYNKCRLTFRVDGESLWQKEFTREGNRPFHFEFDRTWKAGEHELAVELEPLTPDQKRVRSLVMKLDSVTLRGPMEEKFWVKPANYGRFFPKDAPRDAGARHEYAREILAGFARKAYRRPVEAPTVDRLVGLAESTAAQPGKTFEAGIGQAMVAVLASPRFLFREEASEPASGTTHPRVDEYALASRLSYFLWSSMPDEELLRLASERQLRNNLDAQVKRMMVDKKFDGFIRNFIGQWLQSRDIEGVPINARQVLGRENAPDPDFERRRARFRELRDKPDAKLTPEEKKEMDEMRLLFQRRFGQPPRAELNGDLRRAMRRETEMSFEYVLHEDRSLRELLDSNYTFLNERLAKHYGLTNLNVAGDEMQRVVLPADSPRGGLLTQGTVLAVTSNPTRTSPVKRGLFILDNILGTPPPPPPANIPPLEDATKGLTNRIVSLRETLALHREKPLCASCHNRMDPLGLALENFNAMGMWRDQERGQPIDPTATLLTGESFTNIRELKQILATRHAPEFYRTLIEKMLTYALGRGLEYYDVETVDQILDRLEKAEGRPSALFAGIIESAPFQKTRAAGFAPPLTSPQPASPRAETGTTP